MRTFLGFLILVPMLAIVGGCTTTDQNTRPPKAAVEYRPPPDEPAYGKPMEYPPETMSDDPTIKKNKGLGMPGLSNRPGSPGANRPTGF